MEQNSENKTDVDTSEEISLIDILYKDTYRVDSFIAQLLNGTLRNVKTQETSSQGSLNSYSGNIKVASGKRDSSKLFSRLSEASIDPHDHNIIDLLETLDLTPYNELPENSSGKLVHLYGNLCIRDFKTLSSIIPSMAKNNNLFNVDKKEATKIGKMFDVFEKITPFNIEMELSLKNDAIIRGIIKEDYLLTAYRDIVATYGINLPGIWHIIGIFDDISSRNMNNSGSLRTGIDAMSIAIEKMYKDGASNNSIVPIIIFRELDK